MAVIQDSMLCKRFMFTFKFIQVMRLEIVLQSQVYEEFFLSYFIFFLRENYVIVQSKNQGDRS